jgi:UDP-glucose 4-epimerase
LKGITGSGADAIYTDPRPGDVRHSWADITVSEKVLGYNTLVSLEEGLRKTVDYFGGLFQE